MAIVAALAIRWSHVHASGTDSGVPPPPMTNNRRSLYEDTDDNIDPNTYVVVFKDAVSRKKIMQGIIGNTGNRAGADADSGDRVLSDADNLNAQLYDDLHRNRNRNANTNIEIESKSSMEMFDMETLGFRSEEEMQQWVAANGDFINKVCPDDQNILDGAYDFEQQIITLIYFDSNVENVSMIISNVHPNL